MSFAEMFETVNCTLCGAPIRQGDFHSCGIPNRPAAKSIATLTRELDEAMSMIEASRNEFLKLNQQFAADKLTHFLERVRK